MAIVGMNYQIPNIFLGDKGIYFSVCLIFLSFQANSKGSPTNEIPCNNRVGVLNRKLFLLHFSPRSRVHGNVDKLRQ